MKKFFYFICLLFIVSFTIQAQNLDDVVYLKNGSIIHGVILEQVPDRSIKIQTKDGNVFDYNITDIEKITKEEAKTDKANRPARNANKKSRPVIDVSLYPIHKNIRFGVNIGFSFFYPSGVNDKIDADLDAINAIARTNTSLYMNFHLKFDLTYFPVKDLGISGVFDMAAAPKVIIGAESYNFSRLSPGVMCDYYFGKSKRKFFVGGGFLYHIMSFDDHSGSAVGFRGQIGKTFPIKSNWFNLSLVLNLMPAADGKKDYTTDIELNYTDFGIKFGFLF